MLSAPLVVRGRTIGALTLRLAPRPGVRRPGHRPRRAARAPGGAGDRQRAALRGAARDRAHPAAEPAAPHAAAATRHRDRRPVPAERRRRRGRRRLLRRLADRRRRLRDLDRRRCRQGSRRGRPDRADAPRDAGRVALRGVAEPHARGRQRDDPGGARLGRVLHRRAGAAATREGRILVYERLRRATRRRWSCAPTAPSRRPALGHAARRRARCDVPRRHDAPRCTATSSCAGRTASPSAASTATCSARSAWCGSSPRWPDRRPRRSPRAIDDAVVAFAPGLPDDDVAILTLRLVETPAP